MKRLLINLVILFALIASGQAQDKLKVGELKNGKIVVTNLDALKGYFMNSLDNNGAIGKDYQVSIAPEGDRCIIHFPVSGNSAKISSIGIMLIKVRNDFFVITNPPGTDSEVPGAGGSLEIQCLGTNCNACVPNIQWISGTWLPKVYCQCQMVGGDNCDMISKLVIKVEF
jgi:hypothetical protein